MTEPEILSESRNVLPLRAVAPLAFCSVLWAASSVGSKYALMSFAPMTLTVLRFLPAGLLLLLLVRMQGSLPKIEREDKPYFFALGLIGIALTYAVFYTGLKQTSASNASLLIACEVILVALCARIFLGERLNRSQWFGMLLGLCGIYVIAGDAWGDWVVLLGLCLESAVSVIAKRLTGRYPGLFVVAVEFWSARCCSCRSRLGNGKHTRPLSRPKRLPVGFTSVWAVPRFVMGCGIA